MGKDDEGGGVACCISVITFVMPSNNVHSVLHDLEQLYPSNLESSRDADAIKSLLNGQCAVVQECVAHLVQSASKSRTAVIKACQGVRTNFSSSSAPVNPVWPHILADLLDGCAKQQCEGDFNLALAMVDADPQFAKLHVGRETHQIVQQRMRKKKQKKWDDDWNDFLKKNNERTGAASR